jgi:uncharacterized protein (TIGR02246 family)
MKRIAVLLTLALALSACQEMMLGGPHGPYNPQPVAYGPATERQVENSLQRFASLMAAMDANAIANAYAPDGVWERQTGPLRGRDAIRAALASTTGVQVLSFGMKTNSISYNGPEVIQTGEFQQAARMPTGKTTNNAGRFEASWVRGPRGEWWIRRMAFRPH